MRNRSSWTVLAVLLIAGTAAVIAQGTQVRSNLDKKEWAVLAVEMHNGKCKLKEKQTTEFRTEAQGEVSWVVVGYCPPVNGVAQRIGIDSSSFTKANTTTKFNPFDMNASVLEVDVPVSPYGPWSRLIGKIKRLEVDVPVSPYGPWSRLIGKIKPASEVPETVKGHYKYKIKINKADAEHRSPADDGDFFLCPVWPCTI